MKKITFHFSSLEVTNRFGEELGRSALPGDVVCLDGDLGAGKTTLSQAVAGGLEVGADCYVTSPSFAVLHEYPGRLPMYHMDFYRLADYTEVEDLGFDEYFYGKGICVIEWAERAEEILPEARLHMVYSIADDGTRIVECRYHADRYHERLMKILSECGIVPVPSHP